MSPRWANISAPPIAIRAISPIRNSAGVIPVKNSSLRLLLGPHSPALGIRFYTGNMFPKKYKNATFLARHGSWNKSVKFGGDVIS